MTTLARSIGKIAIFVVLFCLGARLIDPATFISLSTAEAFALWLHGNVNQENFEDLWIIAWILSSLVFAVVTYNIQVLLIRKIKK